MRIRIDQKKEEKIQIERFKFFFKPLEGVDILQNISDNTSDKESDNAPDAFFSFNKKKISLEITELKWDKDNKGISKLNQEDYAKKIVQIARRKFEGKSSEKLMVHISFVDHYGYDNNWNIHITKKDIEYLSNHISDLVSKNIPNELNKAIDINKGDLNFRQILDRRIWRINIVKFEFLEENIWEESRGGMVPSLTYEKLYETIKRKNKILKKYKHEYDENWLLILEGFGYGVSGKFDKYSIENLLEKDFENEFDCIIIFMFRYGNIYFLKQSRIELLNDEVSDTTEAK